MQVTLAAAFNLPAITLADVYNSPATAVPCEVCKTEFTEQYSECGFCGRPVCNDCIDGDNDNEFVSRIELCCIDCSMVVEESGED